MLTEDEKITILYPFMPRIGDELTEKDKEEKSAITDRLIVKDRDHAFLKVVLRRKDGSKWETSFELPV